MTPETLVKGARYNWRGQPEKLIYRGTRHYPGDRRTWYQFDKVGEPNKVWGEYLQSDLEHIEPTVPTLQEATQRLMDAYTHTTPGQWAKGLTSHDTVSHMPGRAPYTVGRFTHADDAHFMDECHELVPVLARAVLQGDEAPPVPSDEAQGLVPGTPCGECGHAFDQDKLGAHGCPNCHGEGLDLSLDPVDIRTSGKVVINGQRPGMATLAAGAVDTARLDWLAANPRRISGLGTSWYWTDSRGSLRRAKDLRGAIDQARSE